jgi:hypothetical protein
MPLRLIFSNKGSALNRKLIKFFQINLLSLNKANIIFEFEVAHPKDTKKFISEGIKNFPYMIHNSTSVTGTEKIINYLKLQVNAHNKKIVNKSDDERVDEFWKSTLGNVHVDEAGVLQGDDDDEGDDDMQKKISQAFQDRHTTSEKATGGKPPARENNLSKGSTNVQSRQPKGASLADESPATTLKNMKGGSSMDDELMAKFFENQEESL